MSLEFVISRDSGDDGDRKPASKADSRQETRLVIGRRANGSYRVGNVVRNAGREGCLAILDGDAWLNCLGA